MLEIRPYQEQHRQALLALSLHPSQQDFVKPMAELLASWPSNHHPQVIWADGQVVGFLVFDQDFAIAKELGLKPSLGLRSFFVGQEYQGKGYGKAACLALKQRCRVLFSSALFPRPSFAKERQLALTVNCRNQAAHSLYLACGFVDSGLLYHGGPAGPQHYLTLNIDA